MNHRSRSLAEAGFGAGALGEASIRTGFPCFGSAAPLTWLPVRAAVCLIALVSAACQLAQDPAAAPQGVVLDLVEDLDFADVYVETEQIDFGEAIARAHMVHGWSWDETFAAGNFVWGIGERSSVWFYLVRPGARMLLLTCWSRPLRDDWRQDMTVVVNGTPIGRFTIENQRRDYRVSMPASVLRDGHNELEFRYSHHVREREINPASGGIRPVAVAWDALRIEPAVSGERPARLEHNGAPTLRLPVRSRVDYYLRARPGDVLELDAVELEGQSQLQHGLSLEVRIEGDRPTFSKVVNIGVGRDLAPIAIPVDETATVRISLSARGDGEIEDESALQLIRPMVRGSRRQLEGNVPAPAPLDRHRRPNIVVYNVDTLRPDHLGVYGYPRPTSPNLDSLAKDSIVFTNAHAQTSWTRPAVASILTGLSPDAHGVNGREEALADSAVTLAEILREAGYETAGFVTNGNITHGFGFDQGFDVYEFSDEEGTPAEYADVADWLVHSAVSWLSNSARKRPFFLYLHAINPHGPYDPPARHLQRFADGVLDAKLGSLKVLKDIERLEYKGPDPRDTLRSLYDAEIAWDDERLGDFVDQLKQLSAWDDTLFVFLADHGEEFFEHGWSEHGRTLYAEQLRIPLVVKLPDSIGAGTKSRYPAEQIDVLPTILWYLDLNGGAIEGTSLLPHALNADSASAKSPMFSTLNLDQRIAQSVTLDGLKLIQTLAYDQPKPQFELFDLNADPQESSNLTEQRPVAMGYLRRLLRERRQTIAAIAPTEKGTVSAEVERNLRALGYIE